MFSSLSFFNEFFGYTPVDLLQIAQSDWPPEGPAAALHVNPILRQEKPFT